MESNMKISDILTTVIMSVAGFGIFAVGLLVLFAGLIGLYEKDNDTWQLLTLGSILTIIGSIPVLKLFGL